jgi:hypothetical protein
MVFLKHIVSNVGRADLTFAVNELPDNIFSNIANSDLKDVKWCGDTGNLIVNSK